MKKFIYSMLSLSMIAAAIVSCDSSDSATSDISIGSESATVTISESIGNSVECTINSVWLRENFVSIRAIIEVNEMQNTDYYCTRSVEATAYQWGLQITDVDSESGKFNIYLEAPTDENYRDEPAILTLSIIDSKGEETIAKRSIKYGNVEVVVSGIPLDSNAGTTPTIVTNTITLPDFTCSTAKDSSSGYYVGSVNITGISNGLDGYLELKGTGDPAQNVWLELDNTPKGVLVEKVSTSTRAMNDIVFLVDNSGSMSEEANSIAASIQAWAKELSDAGIDAQFGCVGYNGSVTGAIDLTDVSGISTYLDRYTGTSRTVGYDSDLLSSAASESQYKTTYGECGVVALRFADDQFTFRTGSNRIYVNFTDEPNQTGGYSDNSVEYVNDSSWSGKGTIHSVYSSSSCSTSASSYEDPRLLSTYTGGSSMTVDSDFEGVTLSTLPVSDAIQNSYIISFTNIESYIASGSISNIKLVVKDGEIQSSKNLYIYLTQPSAGL